MTQIHIKLWLNAQTGPRNNTNPVKDEGKVIYSIAGKEISCLFFLMDSDTECVIPRIQEPKHFKLLNKA